MSKIKAGDIVGRKSHHSDLYFKVVDIINGEDGTELAMLKGIDHRLIVFCPLDDLVKIHSMDIEAYWHEVFNRNINQIKNIIKRQEKKQAGNIARALGKINEKHE